MFMNIICPNCGKKSRVPERAFGQRVNCPACSALIHCGPAPSAQAAPVQAAAPVVTPNSSPGQGIHYSCPRCAKPLQSPAEAAGQKTNCPDCGQRLQIPQPSAAPASVPVRVVAPPPPPVPPPAASPPPPREEVIRTVLPAPAPAAPPAPARREHCLECSTDVTDRPRVQTCPDCGSLFCSAMCYREHRYHAHPSRR